MFWAIGVAVAPGRMLGSFLSIHDAESLPLYRMGYLYWPKWNTLCAIRAKSGVSRRSLCLKGQCTLTWAKVNVQRWWIEKNYSNDKARWCDCWRLWRHGAMSTSRATAPTTGYILVIYLANTWYMPKCHIPGIYLVYANGKSIYQVYTWYKTCIYLSYDDIQYIPDIHLLKTFKDISVPFTLRFGHGIYLVYTRYIPWPNRNVTGTKMSLKVLSRCM